MNRPSPDKLLASARVGVDPCFERGRVCRGAYIVANDGRHYLDKHGNWSIGLAGDGNWWDSPVEAQAALLEFRANSVKVENAGSRSNC